MKDETDYTEADAAFEKCFKDGGFRYGREEKMDARWWFRFGYINRARQAKDKEGGNGRHE